MPSQGRYNPATGLWSAGTVHHVVPETLVIRARITSPGSLTNSATITHSDQFDPSATNNARSVVVRATPAVPPTVTSLQRFGFHEQPTEFVLTFSSALDPARAQDVQNYALAPIGPGGQIGRKIRIVSAVFDPLTLTVTLHPATRVYLFARYLLVVNGTTPAGLASPIGTLLDGRGDGEPGSNYVRNFGPAILAGPNPTGATPAVAGSRVATSASTAAIRSSAAPGSPSPAPPAPAATASRGDAGMTASAVDRVLEGFRKPRRRWL